VAQLLPEASLVLPVYNEGRRLSETLAAIRDSTDVPYEAIVVNDASTDSCCNFLRADPPPFPDVVLIDLAKRHGVAPARNLGADRATAPVLVFMDGIAFPGAGGVSGQLVPDTIRSEFPKARNGGLTNSRRSETLANQ
jgi:GT2 family glycosyltransferase